MLSQYVVGTISVTSGSQIVVGSGTSWLGQVSAGDLLLLAGERVPYVIGQVQDNQRLILQQTYAGSSQSIAAYAIIRDYTAHYSLPLLLPGDVMGGAIFTRAMVTLDTALDGMSGDVAALEAAVGGVSGDVAALEATVGGVSGDVAALEAAVGGLSGAVESALHPVDFYTTGILSAGVAPLGWRPGQHVLYGHNTAGSAVAVFSGASSYTMIEFVQGATASTGQIKGYVGTNIFGLGDADSFGVRANSKLHLGASGVKRAEIDLAGCFNVNSISGRGKVTIRGTGASYSMAMEDPALPGHVGLRITGGSGTENLSLYVNGVAVAYAEVGAFRPASDNSASCGTAGGRWSQLFAANATVNTSDGRQKHLRNGSAPKGVTPPPQDLAGAVLTEAERRAFLSVQIFAYQMWQAVDEKGDAARIHIGPITQEIEKAFSAEGLDARTYSFWCEDPLMQDASETYEVEIQATELVERTQEDIAIEADHAVLKVRTEMIEIPRFKQVPLLTASGEPVFEPDGSPRTITAPVMRTEQRTRTISQVIYEDDGITPRTVQGLRASQLLYGILDALRATVAAQETRISALETGG